MQIGGFEPVAELDLLGGLGGHLGLFFKGQEEAGHFPPLVGQKFNLGRLHRERAGAVVAYLDRQIEPGILVIAFQGDMAELERLIGVFDRERRAVGGGDIVLLAGAGGENIGDAADHEEEQNPEFDAFEEIHRRTVA